MAILRASREVSRFPAKSFLPLKIQIKEKKFLPGTRRALTLTVREGKLSLTKPKFITTGMWLVGRDLSGAKTDLRSRPLKGGGVLG
jgi:hypothetical protein